MSTGLVSFNCGDWVIAETTVAAAIAAGVGVDTIDV